MDYIQQKLLNAYNAFEQNRLKQAEILYLACLDKIDNQETLEFKQALHGLALVKTAQEKFTEAREVYLQLLHRAESEQNLDDQAMALHQLGMVERLSGNFKKALELFKSEEVIYKANEADFIVEYAVNLYEQALIFKTQNQFEQTNTSLQQSLNYAKSTEDKHLIGSVYALFGDLQLQQGFSKEAKDYYKQSLLSFETVEDLENIRIITEKLESL